MSDLAGTFKHLNPQPGDVFTLSVGAPLSAEMVDRIRDDLAKAIPAGCKVLILDGGVELEPTALSADAREKISAELAAYPEVRWDRFIEYGGKIGIYGWLDRDDGRADFLLLDFVAATGELKEWTTSAHPHPASVVERLEGDESVECQRAEDHFDAPNVVRLREGEGEGSEERTGAELIAAERGRQVSEEGWTPEHDDQHTGCEMALAAMVYADPRPSAAGRDPNSPALWPWEREWFKPRDYLSNLVKAGGLIAAEIDRLQRAERGEGEQ